MRMSGKKYDPKIHHRRSIRLHKYDYSQAGAYFITMCLKNRQNLFGKIMTGKMILNEPGKMIVSQWHALQHRFKNIELDEYIVMPNHFHGIIILNEKRRDESCIHPGIQPGIHPGIQPGIQPGIHPGIQPDNESSLNSKGEYKIRPFNQSNRPTGTTNDSIGRIIQAFKSITTNIYIRCVKQKGWEHFPGKLWQPNYFERVIRDENELNRIREYIISNPGKWQNDKDNQ
jgi:REP-associated tyrosine transposase